MSQHEIGMLYTYLNKASGIAQQYPELDAVWGQIEDIIYELSVTLESFENSVVE